MEEDRIINKYVEEFKKGDQTTSITFYCDKDVSKEDEDYQTVLNTVKFRFQELESKLSMIVSLFLLSFIVCRQFKVNHS